MQSHKILSISRIQTEHMNLTLTLWNLCNMEYPSKFHTFHIRFYKFSTHDPLCLYQTISRFYGSIRPIGGPMRPTTIASVSDVVPLWTRDLAQWKKNDMVWHRCGCFQKYGKTPKSSILIGFSIINHPFWGTPIFGNTHVVFFFFNDFVQGKFMVLLMAEILHELIGSLSHYL